MSNANNSSTNGASDTGYNVYRTQSDDETDQVLVGSYDTLDVAYAAARHGEQIQHGLDGQVTNK